MVRAWLRCFTVQGSWNYKTLVASGVAFAMMPLLRRIHADDPDALSASLSMHLESFNTHPYLASLAVGALARLEHDGAAPEEIARFRMALRGPLGTLGDRTVWAEWRPFCLLAGITAFGLGMAPGWSAAIFLVTYNIGHLWLRWWGFHAGWIEGRGVGRLLRNFPFERFTDRLWPVTMFLLGASTVLLGRTVIGVAGQSSVDWALLLVAGLTAVPAFRWPNRFGRLAVTLLLAMPFVWLLLAVTNRG